MPWKLAETVPVLAMATNIASIIVLFTARQLERMSVVFGNTEFVQAGFPGTLPSIWKKDKHFVVYSDVNVRKLKLSA